MGSDLPSSQRCIDLAAGHEAVYAAVGVHPHEAKDASADYLDTLADLLKAPKVVAMRPEASFLLWLDFRAYGLPHDELVRILIEEGKVGLNSGLDYGADGEGFMRLNFGCPRATLEEGLRRICDVLRNR